MSLDRHHRHPRQPRLHPRQKGGHWLAHPARARGASPDRNRGDLSLPEGRGPADHPRRSRRGVASDDQLRTIAERTVIPGESSHNEPFPVTAETLVPALRAADQLGRQRC